MNGKGDKRRPGKGYAENYDRIFEIKSEESQARLEETIRQCRERDMTNEETEAHIENYFGLDINIEELDRESEDRRLRQL